MIEAHNLIDLSVGVFEKAILDDFGLKIADTQKIENGWSSQVYKAKLGNQEVFVRINKEPRVYLVEEAGYKRMKEAGVPVPEVLDFKEAPNLIGYPTMILTAANGEPLGHLKTSPDQEMSLWEEAGK